MCGFQQPVDGLQQAAESGCGRLRLIAVEVVRELDLAAWNVETSETRQHGWLETFQEVGKWNRVEYVAGGGGSQMPQAMNPACEACRRLRDEPCKERGRLTAPLANKS
jgi:hypothetical protein